MQWVIAVGNTAEWSSLFCMLGTQRSNTVVAQRACRSSCDSYPPSPRGAGSWCNTSSRDNIICTPHPLSFGLSRGHLILRVWEILCACVPVGEVYLWLFLAGWSSVGISITAWTPTTNIISCFCATLGTSAFSFILLHFAENIIFWSNISDNCPQAPTLVAFELYCRGRGGKKITLEMICHSASFVIFLVTVVTNESATMEKSQYKKTETPVVAFNLHSSVGG